jgi:predicted nucleic acid-binding protein
MDIVIDANVTVALVVNLPYSSQAENYFRQWRKQNVRLHAPALWPAEIASALRKLEAVGQLASQDTRLVVQSLALLPVQIHIPDVQLLQASLDWAVKLEQVVAYDAQYLALAEILQAEFWTADHRLYKTMQKLKIGWVHAIASGSKDG